MERMTGVEPAFKAWEAFVLPMNYIRKVCLLGTSHQSSTPFPLYVADCPVPQNRFALYVAVLRGQELLEGTKSKVWGHLREGKCHI